MPGLTPMHLYISNRFCFKQKWSHLTNRSVTYFHLTSVSMSGHTEILHRFCTVGKPKFTFFFSFCGYKHFCEKYPSSSMDFLKK